MYIINIIYIMMLLNKKNSLRIYRTNTSNRKDISTKRFIKALVPYKVTKLGRFTQPDPNGLDLARQQLGWDDTLTLNDQIPSLLSSNRPSPKMDIKTALNGQVTEQLPVVKLPQNSEKFKTDVEQLVDTVGNVPTNQVKVLCDNFSSDGLSHIKNLWADCISMSTAIDKLALELGGNVSIRLIRSLSENMNLISREHILNYLSIDNNLHIITIDRFEIFITNITWYPFFNAFLPKIHNLIININSYEFCGNELCNTSTWLLNKLGTSEDYNNLLKVKNELIFNQFYPDMYDLLEIIQLLGEGELLS
jgi:hypothetical protein